MWHLTLPWPPWRGQKHQSRQTPPSSKWFATQITALYRVLPASEYCCLWLAQRAPGDSLIRLKQANWFCFFPQCVRVSVSMSTNCLQCIHMRRGGFIYGGETLPGMHECSLLNHKHTQLWHTSRILQTGGDIEAVISLFISVWEQPIWHMFMAAWWNHFIGGGKRKIKQEWGKGGGKTSRDTCGRLLKFHADPLLPGSKCYKKIKNNGFGI